MVSRTRLICPDPICPDPICPDPVCPGLSTGRGREFQPATLEDLA
jgi:hypothetical protein